MKQSKPQERQTQKDLYKSLNVDKAKETKQDLQCKKRPKNNIKATRENKVHNITIESELEWELKTLKKRGGVSSSSIAQR